MAQTKDPIDIGAAFTYATSDPDWMKKVVIAGLHMFVPLLGVVALFGWTREIFFRVKRGEEGLPDIQFGKHLSEGWAPIVALMSLSLLIFVLMIPMLCGGVFMAAAEETGSDAARFVGTLVMLLSQLLMMVGVLAINVLAPEFWRRGFHGEMGPVFSIGKSLRNIKDHAIPCLLVIVGFFVAQMVGSIGVMACYVGMFLTLPFSYVVMAHLVAQWDILVSGEEPPGAEDDDWQLAPKA